MKFSIIIPLEDNRGIAVKCIRSWTQDQRYPRNDYQLLVAAPPGYPGCELQSIRAFLSPQDHILKYQDHHALELAATAVNEAMGDIYVFTESHCLPDPDFLEKSGSVLNEHPEWGGFRGGSFPITHNLLSEIESELYSRDIHSDLMEQEWFKVLDQCFIIRRADYHLSGGLERRYGHFAEWLFAARLYSKGTVIGHAPQVRAGHYYIGQLKELETFTRDFTEGEMRFASEGLGNPCHRLFKTIQEWEKRSRWNQTLTHPFFVLLLASWRNSRSPETTVPSGQGEKNQRSILYGLMGLGLHKLYPLSFALRHARVTFSLETLLLRLFLFFRCRKGATRLFQQWTSTLIRLGRLMFLDGFFRHPSLAIQAAARHAKSWTPETATLWESLGFHELEYFGKIPFRWTETTACLRLPLGPGPWKVLFHFTDILSLHQVRSCRFFANSQPLAPTIHSGTSLSLDCPSPAALFWDISWICDAFQAPGDARRLGLPVAKIEWRRPDEPSGGDSSPEDSAPYTTYFLHVPKCAGTTICSILENHYHARDCLFPYLELYNTRELDAGAGAFKPAPFIVGHFGWDLIARTNHPWRVLTILRQPYERILSEYGYQKQHRRIAPDKSLINWLEEDVDPRSLLFRHFIPDFYRLKARGIQELQLLMESSLDQALENLRTCTIVGLQEKMEDSINLLCHASGSYPPLSSPRFNATLRRDQWENLSEQDRSYLDRHFLPECLLYEEAVKLFDFQLARLRAELSQSTDGELDAENLRTILRKRYFARLSIHLGNVATPPDVCWKPEDVYRGENLHKREIHEGQSLRWTGPETKTFFYFPLGSPGRKGKISFTLHPATPWPHVEAASLKINEQKIPLARHVSGQRSIISGTFLLAPNKEDYGAFAELILETPVIRGHREFRTLGIALQEIAICFE